MIVAVARQPSLSLDDPAGVEISEEDARNVAERLLKENLSVQGYRFDDDQDGEPTRAALDSLLKYLQESLIT